MASMSRHDKAMIVALKSQDSNHSFLTWLEAVSYAVARTHMQRCEVRVSTAR